MWVRILCSLLSSYMNDVWVNSKITSHSVFKGSRLLSLTPLFISVLFPLAPWCHHGPANRPLPACCPSSHCAPGCWHQTPPCPASLRSAHSGPCVSLTGFIPCPSLTHCPPVAPWLYLPYLLMPSCLCHAPTAAPLSPGARGANIAPDYLCVAASVLCSD